MYANITLFFYIRKQIAKIFHIAGIYFSIFLHISKIMLIFVVNFLGVMLVIIFVSMVLVVVKRWAFFIVLQMYILSILFNILIMILVIQCMIQIIIDDYINIRGEIYDKVNSEIIIRNIVSRLSDVLQICLRDGENKFNEKDSVDFCY